MYKRQMGISEAGVERRKRVVQAKCGTIKTGQTWALKGHIRRVSLSREQCGQLTCLGTGSDQIRFVLG